MCLMILLIADITIRVFGGIFSALVAKFYLQSFSSSVPRQKWMNVLLLISYFCSFRFIFVFAFLLRFHKSTFFWAELNLRRRNRKTEPGSLADNYPHDKSEARYGFMMHFWFWENDYVNLITKAVNDVSETPCTEFQQIFPLTHDDLFQ